MAFAGAGFAEHWSSSEDAPFDLAHLTRVTRTPLARSGKGEYPLLSTLIIRHDPGLAASPGSCRIIAGRGQNLRKWEERHACVGVDVWVTRVRRTGGGTRGAVAGTRRGAAGVRAAGRGGRGAAGRCRRAAGAGRPAGAPADARVQVPVRGGRTTARGRVDRRAVRHGRRGGRGM